MKHHTNYLPNPGVPHCPPAGAATRHLLEQFLDLLLVAIVDKAKTDKNHA